MKIAILGWGSLVWDARELPYQGHWMNDGPELPLEFSRISRDCRLTLVIDAVNGELCKSCYVLSTQTSLAEAALDLLTREGTIENRIGHYDHRTKESSIEQFAEQVNIKYVLSSWCDGHFVDGVVWTALPPNFPDELDAEFNVERAIIFLKGLSKTARKRALWYFYKAPEQIDTPLRRRVKREWPEY